jgi:hypothetical protein
MARAINRLSCAFAAGSLGGLVNGLMVWAFGVWGITTGLGVQIAPELTGAMLYHRLVWGGLWGLVFILPLWQKSLFLRGLFISLGPTLVQLLVIFPFQAQKGFLGLDLGVLTPVFVVVFNAVWGWVAAIWLSWSRLPLRQKLN